MMVSLRSPLLCCALAAQVVQGLRYVPEHEGWNLNENKTATDPLDYWGEWKDHTYNPSPANWRVPFYVLTVDRYVDGDPTNNEANGTNFEHDWNSNQFRFGGDVRGLMNNLDYIQGMGIKVCSYMMSNRTPANSIRLFTCLALRSLTCHGPAMASDLSTLRSWITIMA